MTIPLSWDLERWIFDRKKSFMIFRDAMWSQPKLMIFFARWLEWNFFSQSIWNWQWNSHFLAICQSEWTHWQNQRKPSETVDNGKIEHFNLIFVQKSCFSCCSWKMWFVTRLSKSMVEQNEAETNNARKSNKRLSNISKQNAHKIGRRRRKKISDRCAKSMKCQSHIRYRCVFFTRSLRSLFFFGYHVHILIKTSLWLSYRML